MQTFTILKTILPNSCYLRPNKKLKFFDISYFYQKFVFLPLLTFLLFAVGVNSQTYEFTNADATGRLGPDQTAIDNAYDDTNLDGEVTVIGDGIQEWEVPETGLYRITAYGAQGGTAGGGQGGKGAMISGDFNLTAGEIIHILVGQKGGQYSANTYRYQSSGGGGSFVVFENAVDEDDILLIAGGGGGYGHARPSGISIDGRISTDGGAGSGHTSSSSGGSDGMGGESSTGTTFGGGGGFFGAGETSTSRGGRSFLDGGQGGDSNNTAVEGGFGGGGGVTRSALNNNRRGGGGGGFSGGGAAHSTGNLESQGAAGGGGGSYNNGDNQNNKSGEKEDDGLVIIQKVNDHDAGVYQLISPVDIVKSLEDAPFYITIKNYGLYNLTEVDVFYSLNGEPTQGPFQWTGNIERDEVSDFFYVDDAIFNNGINTLEIWTENPNGEIDEYPGNDRIIVEIEGCPDPMSGTYTVGPGLDFETIGDAITAMENSCGISGPVIFELAAETFPEQVLVQSIVGSSPMNTVTFRGQAGSIIENSATTLGRGRINIDGAKHIRIENIEIGPQRYGIHIGSNSHDIKILNCEIITSITSSTAHMGIVISGDKTDYSVEATNVRDIVIEGNSITGGHTTISVLGSDIDLIQGIEIKNNSINESHWYGINIEESYAPDIFGNTIFDVNSAHGINLSGLYGAFDISSNDFYGIRRSGIVVRDFYGTEDAVGLISNNSVGGGFNYSSTLTTAGIDIYNGSYIDIIHNSIDMDNPDAGGKDHTAAITIRSGSNNVRFINNSLVYSGHVDGNRGVVYILGSPFIEHDYNNYFRESPGDLIYLYGGETYSNLAEFQNATGQEANSVSGDPHYIDPISGNLQSDITETELLLNAGIGIDFIKKDIDGNYRHPLKPDIGAYEHNPMPENDAGISQAITDPTYPLCDEIYTDPVDIYGVVRNYTTAPLTSAEIYYELNGGPAQGPVLWEGYLDFKEESLPVFLGTENFIEGNNTLVTWTENPNGNPDENKINDTLIVIISAAGLINQPIIDNQTVVCGESITLEPTCGQDMYIWFDGTGENMLGYGETFTTPVLNEDTSYKVAAFTSYSLSGTVTFTNCGASGAEGPTQLDVDYEYFNTNLDDQVISVNGLQRWIAPVTGTYTIEAYGASGGGADVAHKGLGGFATGKIDLQQGDTLYISAGQEGQYGFGKTYPPVGGFGGGGDGGEAGSADEHGSSGGGASDIRLGNRYLNNRIVVAAGGGGGAGDGTISRWRSGGGGGGGGYYGGGGGHGGTKGPRQEGKGGTQNQGGEGGGCNDSRETDGAFGTGGHGGNTDNTSTSPRELNYKGGDGGGEIGEDGTISDDSAFPASSGGGGSSFIANLYDSFTDSGVNEGHGYVVISFEGLVDSGCISDTTTVLVEVELPEEPDVTSPVTINCGESTILNVSGSTGNYVWYDDEGNVVGSGSSFETPDLTANTTYYVAASKDYIPDDLTLTFTNCEAFGRLGPSQSDADNEYIGTDLEGEVTIVGNGIQQWEAPYAGVYNITAYGAQGGAEANTAGLGARISGDFELQQGERLNILVGQQGGSEDDISGGGGSFVVRQNGSFESDILVIAGGGGGGGQNSEGLDAVVSTSGTSDGSGNNEGGTDGDGGEGYASGGRSASSGSGAGMFGDGYAEEHEISYSFVNGGKGGEGAGFDVDYPGGFGGGGGGAWFNWGAGGGGGGGYSGGAGGYRSAGSSHGGGGGGSYNSGDNQDNESGVREGHGLVIISYKFSSLCVSDKVPVHIEVEPEYYQTIMSGDWYDVDIWEECCEGTCVPALEYPQIPYDGQIFIREGHVVDIDGDWTNNADITKEADSEINITGDWTNNGTVDTELGGAFRFSGSFHQTIDPGGSDFNDVIFDNTKDACADLEITSPMVINGNADFNDGVVYFSNTGSMTFTQDATSNGGSDDSFVDGEVVKEGTSAFDFPVGESCIYAPLSISEASGGDPDESFTASYYHTDPDLAGYDVTSKEASINNVSRMEYWILDRSEGVTNEVQVTLSWDYSRSGGVENLDDLIVARWDDTQWNNKGQSSITGDFISGTITSNLVSDFSPFTLSSESPDNPLPIELLSFEAECDKDGNALITWKTATEINNDYFILEKSKDGKDFTEIAKIDGQGYSNRIVEYSYIDEHLFFGDNYYRLKQVDFDGTTTEYNIIHINCDRKSDEAKAAVSPNPFRSEITIYLENIEDNHVYFEIYSETGSLITRKRYDIESDPGKYVLDLDDLEPATYLLRIITDRHLFNHKIIKN